MVSQKYNDNPLPTRLTVMLNMEKKNPKISQISLLMWAKQKHCHFPAPPSGGLCPLFIIVLLMFCHRQGTLWEKNTVMTALVIFMLVRSYCSLLRPRTEESDGWRLKDRLKKGGKTVCFHHRLCIKNGHTEA